MNRLEPNKLVRLLVYLSMAVISFCVLLFLAWSYQPTDVLKFNTYPIPVRKVNTPPPAGGVVILRVNYCKTSNAEGNVRTSFVSKSGEMFLPTSVDRQAKGCVNTELPVLIPKDLPPDVYHIHFKVIYQVNPVKNALIELDTVEFQVVNSQ